MFVAPVIGLAIASAAGMGGGGPESGDRTDLVQRAVVMAVASAFGVIVVALPFFYLQGTAALVTSLVLALGLGAWIAERRASDLGRGLGIPADLPGPRAAIGVTSAVSVMLPGSGG